MHYCLLWSNDTNELNRIDHLDLIHFLEEEARGNWFIHVERYLQEVGITREGVQERDPLEEKLKVHHGLRTGNVWTERKKKERRKRMYWTEVKAQGREQLE